MNKLLWMMLSVLVALPIAANAEVYKWVDKDGVVRYSDTPPPSNIERLPVNGKKPTTIAAPPAAVAAPTEATEGEAAAPATAPPPAKKKPAASPEAAATKRQEGAETDKKKTEQKDAELKRKQENCAAAKKNYANYKVGGRMSTTDEAGNRQYLSDADIAKGLAQAQKDIDENCE